MHDEKIAIGKRIRAYREKMMLSQKELGDKVGMSQQQIGQYETGIRCPKIETLRRIAKALNIECDELATGLHDLVDFEEIMVSKKAYALLVGALGLYGYDLSLESKCIVVKVI